MLNLLEKGGIAEQVKLLDPCVDIKCRASYYPYFYGDKQCELMLTCLVKIGRISPEEYQSLQGQLEKLKHELGNKLRVVPSDGYVNTRKMTGLKDYIIVCSIRLTPADSSFKRFRHQSELGSENSSRC